MLGTKLLNARTFVYAILIYVIVHLLLVVNVLIKTVYSVCVYMYSVILLCSYFNQTIGILRKDPSLYCISAWNDFVSMHMYVRVLYVTCVSLYIFQKSS